MHARDAGGRPGARFADGQSGHPPLQEQKKGRAHLARTRP